MFNGAVLFFGCPSVLSLLLWTKWITKGVSWQWSRSHHEFSIILLDDSDTRKTIISVSIFSLHFIRSSSVNKLIQKYRPIDTLHGQTYVHTSHDSHTHKWLFLCLFTTAYYRVNHFIIHFLTFMESIFNPKSVPRHNTELHFPQPSACHSECIFRSLPLEKSTLLRFTYRVHQSISST